VVFFCCCHSNQALDRMQATQGGAGYSVDFTAVAIFSKIRSSILIREAVDANPPFSKLDSRMSLVTPSGLKDIAASRRRITV